MAAEKKHANPLTLPSFLKKTYRFPKLTGKLFESFSWIPTFGEH